MKTTLMINAILNFSKERGKVFLLCLFFLALSMRLCAVFLYTFLPMPKAEINLDYEYGAIARAIADGKGYSAPIVEFDSNFIPKDIIGYRPTANQPPFFPYFLSFFYSFSNGPIAFFLIRFIHAIVSALTCVIIYLVSIRLIHYKAAFLLGVLCSFYPTFISLTVRILPETFFTFWLSLTILYLFILKDSPSLKNIAITGLLMGITVLNNVVVISFFPIVFIWLLLNLKGAIQKKLLKISLVFFVSIIIVTPWLIRNYIVFNKFPLFKSVAGRNLWIGNNPLSSGTVISEDKKDLNDMISKRFPETFKLSEVDQDDILYREAIDYIKANPTHYLKLVLKRFYYFWWFPPDELITKTALSYKKLMAIPCFILLLSCVFGIFKVMINNWRNCFLLVALMLSISFLYSLIVVGPLRYKVPIEPYILLFASQIIFRFTRRLVDFTHNIMN